MSKPYGKRKHTRDRKRADQVKGKCDFEGCTARSKVKQECLTCERLRKEVYTVNACHAHAAWSQQKIRRHSLVKHPSNIVGAIGAALGGEEVF
jgi:hypothetical protein